MIEKRLGGRPVRYSNEEIDKLADEFLIWLDNSSNIWFKDFCLDKDINPDLMSEWAKQNERFSGAYNLAKHKQESRILNGGLLNKYNSNIVKLILTNKHGWAEKSETKITGDSNDPLSCILVQITGNTKELVNEPKE